MIETLAQRWDKWRDAHGISELILEMYRRHGDKPGYKCEQCERLNGGVQCEDYDPRCDFIDCKYCPLHDFDADPYWCELYSPSPYATAWDPAWTACGAYDGPEPMRPKDNQEAML